MPGHGCLQWYYSPRRQTDHAQTYPHATAQPARYRDHRSLPDLVDHLQPPAQPVRVIKAHLGELPGLINADKTGPFVDLVHGIDALYPDMTIEITIYPIARAMAGVINGKADFSLPAIRNLHDADMLPYRFSTRSFGKVAHVIYSNTANPVSTDMAYGIEATQRDLLIEAVPGELPFQVQRSMSIEQSLRKLSRGRIDAFIWAQEEADLMLRQLGLTNIQREFFWRL